MVPLHGELIGGFKVYFTLSRSRYRVFRKSLHQKRQIWGVSACFSTVLPAKTFGKLCNSGSQRMYVRTEHIWVRCPISLDHFGLAVSPRSGMVGCLGCDNPLDRRPAASGRYRYCGPAITRCRAQVARRFASRHGAARVHHSASGRSRKICRRIQSL